MRYPKTPCSCKPELLSHLSHPAKRCVTFSFTQRKQVFLPDALFGSSCASHQRCLAAAGLLAKEADKRSSAYKESTFTAGERLYANLKLPASAAQVSGLSLFQLQSDVNCESERDPRLWHDFLDIETRSLVLELHHECRYAETIVVSL